MHGDKVLEYSDRSCGAGSGCPEVSRGGNVMNVDGITVHYPPEISENEPQEYVQKELRLRRSSDGHCSK